MLVEVLVSLLLAALALAALAGAQASAQRASRGHMHRLVAAQLASDLGERLRASRHALGDPVVAGAYAFMAVGEGTTEPHATLCDGPSANCTPLQFAQADAAQWQQLLRLRLPGGSALVRLTIAQSTADVWVGWLEPPLPGDDTLPQPQGGCPAELFPGRAGGLRCTHVRVPW